MTKLNGIRAILWVYFFLFSFLLQSFELSAQQFLADVEFYNHENGLAGRFANCTFEDSRGLVWIGTQFGLNRFDGRDFLLFDEVNGLPFNQVMEIYEDSDGWLWLFRSCYGKNSCARDLAFFHSVSHEVLTFEGRFGGKVNFSPEEILGILSTDNGDIYLSAKNQVLQWSEGKILKKLDWVESENTPMLLAQVDKGQMVAWHHVENEAGYSYMSSFVFDLEGKVYHHQEIPNPGGQKSIKTLRLTGRNHLGQQMVRIEDYSKTPVPQMVLRADGKIVEDTSAWKDFPRGGTFVHHPLEETAWSFYNGIQMYDRHAGLVYNFADYFSELDQLLYPRELRFDEQGLFWLSGRYGVFKVYLEPNPFTRILYNPLSDLESPIKHLCQGVTLDKAGNYLMGTNSGLYELHQDSFDSDAKLRYEITFPPLKFTRGYQGDLWGISSYGYSMRIRDEADSFEVERKGLPIDKVGHIYSQFYLSDTLLLGTDQGLHYFDHIENHYADFLKYNGYDELKSQIIHFIQEGEEGNLWLCTSGGLYSCSPNKGILNRYWEGGIGEFKIPATSFYHLRPAQKGGWWLASQQGLVYWNPENNESQIYTYKDGLPANEILAVHEDDFGFLWLPTNNGLVQFQISTGQSKVWSETDGISSNDFEPYTYFSHDDGTVWFGTTNGFTVFHPKDFKDFDPNQKPKVPLNILSFEQFSTETEKMESRTQALIEAQKIVLQPGEPLFALRVALADYLNGDGTQYAYQIEGYQDFWQEGPENVIRISGLPYGEYAIRIKGRLASGQYSAQEIYLPIHVLRPFYLKTWFFILLGAIVFGAVFLWLRWRTSQLERQQVILKKLVKERTLTIEQQTEELKSLEKLKSRFFANVSHELRTPLTLMLGPVNTLLKKKERGDDESKLLSFIQRNAEQLQKLINEILDLSKLEANKLEVREEPVLLNAYLKDQLAQFHSFSFSEKLKFETHFNFDGATQVFLDVDKFEKILHNFLSNAMKFTPSGGRVGLSVDTTDAHLLISVSDSGRGIHPDDLPHVFDRFYQSKQPDAKTEGGTGIGLSLSKELAELLGGKVWVESEWGRGSVFHFQLPKKVVPEDWVAKAEVKPQLMSFEKLPALIVEPSVKNKADRPTILVVEDNPDLRDYLKYLLSDFQVLTAENGKVGLDVLNEEPGCQLIISDLMMPVMDGHQFLEKLKSDDRWRHLPTIMLTAKVNARAKLKALRIGVDDYLTKPFQEEELKARIENLLRNYRERMEYFSSQSEAMEEPSAKPEKPIMAEVDAQWLEEVEEAFSKIIGDSSLNFDWIAGQMHISQRQLGRRLKQLTGLTPSQYFHETRMMKAYDFLVEGKYATVKEVSFAIGIRDAKYFSKRFQERFGVTPSAVR